MICRHCQKSKVNRPRGLCWSCYYTPGVKEQYPSTSKYARRGVGNFTGNAPLADAQSLRSDEDAGARRLRKATGIDGSKRRLDKSPPHGPLERIERTE